MNNVTKLLGAGVLLAQLLDMLLHVRIDQAEPLRIASNVIMIAWIAALFLGQKARNIALGATGIYLLLNLAFLMQHGFTNADLGGAPRTGLLVFVLATLALSGLLLSRLQEKIS